MEYNLNKTISDNLQRLMRIKDIDEHRLSLRTNIDEEIICKLTSEQYQSSYNQVITDLAVYFNVRFFDIVRPLILDGNVCLSCDCCNWAQAELIIDQCARITKGFVLLEKELGCKTEFNLPFRKCEYEDIPRFVSEIKKELGFNWNKPTIGLINVLRKKGIKTWLGNSKWIDSACSVSITNSKEECGICVVNPYSYLVPKEFLIALELGHILLCDDPFKKKEHKYYSSSEHSKAVMFAYAFFNIPCDYYEDSYKNLTFEALHKELITTNKAAELLQQNIEKTREEYEKRYPNLGFLKQVLTGQDKDKTNESVCGTL